MIASLIAVAAVSLFPAGMPVRARHDVVVDEFPLWKSPRVMDGRIYAIDSHGDDVYVGGTFTTVRDAPNDAPTISQAYVFKFDARTGAIDPNFRPTLDGVVEGLAVSLDGSAVYLGGRFDHVNGTKKNRLVKLSTSDGSIISQFNGRAGGPVTDLALTDSAVVIGGYFRMINGLPAERLGAVDPTTGEKLDGFETDLTGTRDPGSSAYVQELDVSADQRWLVVGGNFTTASGEYREQVAVYELDGTTAQLAPWSTTRFASDCAEVYNQTWIRGISISPDSTFFVVSTTGAYQSPPSLCDTATRWELPLDGPRLDAVETWSVYTGGDTHWASLVTESAVYVGGHQRWENNSRPSPGGDNDGPGAVSRSGIAALDPLTGVPLSWNPGRDRGRGVEAMHATDDYLYVGSDTVLFNGQVRQRLAMLPTAGGTPNPAPVPVTLPVKMRYVIGSDLYEVPFDGTTFGAPTKVGGPDVDGEDWAAVRDMFVQSGQHTYFGPNGAYYRRSFDGSTYGSPVNLSATVGYVDVTHSLTPYDQPYNVAEIRDATYSNGRILYTRTNETRLWWRFYSIESGIISSEEAIASGIDWRNARALDAIGDSLYVAWADGKLYEAPLQGGDVAGSPSTWTVVDDGASGIDWRNVTAIASVSAEL